MDAKDDRQQPGATAGSGGGRPDVEYLVRLVAVSHTTGAADAGVSERRLSELQAAVVVGLQIGRERLRGEGSSSAAGYPSG